MRVYNFSAGPSTLPLAVLEQVQQELLDYQGTGKSIMEVSHRGDLFLEIAAQSEQRLRQLLAIPEQYAVLFLQGGAQTQFSTIPMQLSVENKPATYLNTGQWSKKAIAAAQQYTDVTICGETSTEAGKVTVPKQADWTVAPDSAYLHITDNETIDGVELPKLNRIGDIPLVSDMSSNILSKPIDVTNYDLIYAGAQKNISIAGLTIVIINKACLPSTPRFTPPKPLNYLEQMNNNSMANTPPTFAWYIANLVFKWLIDQGGLDSVAQQNSTKATLLYDTIDQSSFYSNPVNNDYRSTMNIPFLLNNADLNAQFLQQAEAAGLTALKGHRLVGGMRASLYNALPLAGVEALVDFMKHFAEENS